MTLVVCLPPLSVTTADGETRPVTQIWPDGSWSCPFCNSPNLPGDTRTWDGPCSNPACLVGGWGSPENVARVRLEHEQAAEAASQRAWLHRAQEADRASREESRRAAVDVFGAEAQEHGYCIECWGRSTGWGMWLSRVKRVKHRRPENCPSIRRRRS